MTLETLAARLDGIDSKLEQILTSLPSCVAPGRDDRRSVPATSADRDEFYDSLGLEAVEPIGAVALRQLLVESGWDPGSSAASRELIAERDS